MFFFLQDSLFYNVYILEKARYIYFSKSVFFRSIKFINN